MWSGVQNNIADAGANPIAAASSGADAVLGPSFDYLGAIQSPANKGVSSDGNLGQVFTNTKAIGGYVGNLLIGPKLGNQLFSDTGGTCKTPDGRIVPRWTWINNKLGFDDAAGVLGTSFQNAVGGSGVDGIVPGMGGDIAAMNPFKIMNALVLDGSPPCQLFTCPVTLPNGTPKGTETHYLTPSLELSMKGCVEAPPEAPPPPEQEQETAVPPPGEKFTPYFMGGDAYGPNVLTYNDPTPAILLCAAVALFVGYVVLVKKRR
jgi:hypothetical protein